MKQRIDILECYISEGEIITSDGDVYEFSSPEDFPEGESFMLNTNCQFIIKDIQKFYYLEFDSQSIYDEDWEDEEPKKRRFELIYYFELDKELKLKDFETSNLKTENINNKEFISKFFDSISEDIIPLCGEDLIEEKPFVEIEINTSEKVIKEYHENGNIKIEREVNSEGTSHGITKLYHENGQLQIQVEFTNGKQNDGEITSFHDNGNKARCVFLVNGNYEGEFFEWHKNGVMSRKGLYENDEVIKEELWDEDNNPIEKRDEVVKQYKIKDDNPSSMDSGLIGTKLFKRDITGLMSYFEERPNMERLFNELTHFTRDGYTVEDYLDNTNFMDDEEVKTIIGLGFIDISGFLEDMLKIEENIELRKDYESCLTISKILLKNFESELNSLKSDTVSNDNVIDENFEESDLEIYLMYEGTLFTYINKNNNELTFQAFRLIVECPDSEDYEWEVKESLGELIFTIRGDSYETYLITELPEDIVDYEFTNGVGNLHDEPINSIEEAIDFIKNLKTISFKKINPKDGENICYIN